MSLYGTFWPKAGLAGLSIGGDVGGTMRPGRLRGLEVEDQLELGRLLYSFAGVRLAIADRALGLPVLGALFLVYMLPPLPRPRLAQRGGGSSRNLKLRAF
jgi:hypothetical protein